MKSPFLLMHNAVSALLDHVPGLPLESWRQTILDHCLHDQARVISLFGVPEKHGAIRVYCVLGFDHRHVLCVGATDFAPSSLQYESLASTLPETHLFERELYEDYGILPSGHPWPKPVRKLDHSPCITIEGDAVHEVAVGPVHAGIIEPGHFRFQCHGETVLHLDIRLGYQHRGVESLLVQADELHRAVLAESIAGDTVIGHGLASAQAMEALSETGVVTQRAHALRGLALELERLANHVGDLGSLANDIGFLPASAFFGRLRGEFLNLLLEVTGNRYGRSFVRPGGVLHDVPAEMATHIRSRLAVALKELKELVELFFDTSSVLTRLESTGTVSSELAKEIGLVGIAARASHLPRDVRQDYPFGLYRVHPLPLVTFSSGDVYARARLRSVESKRSLEYLLDVLQTLPPGAVMEPVGKRRSSSLVVSLVEGWRGEIAHVVLTNEDGNIMRYKVVDPSFHNWTALALAMRQGQISDFPLCNKSFNLSYAGHDL